MARVAVVSGGTRGIAISKALQAAGHMVAANYAGNDDAAAKFKVETRIAVYNGMFLTTRPAPKDWPKSATKLGLSISSSITRGSPATPWLNDAIRLWTLRLGPGMVDILHREIEFIFVMLGIAAIFRAAVGQNTAEPYLLFVEERHDAIVQEI